MNFGRFRWCWPVAALRDTSSRPWRLPTRCARLIPRCGSPRWVPSAASRRGWFPIVVTTWN
ncbi:Uncharacterised protein [Mycobacteroides abscessus subsp. abscessus]|nr:Uncharacterised protein [Mycobacteroides abscessus subsp. abscessus]